MSDDELRDRFVRLAARHMDEREELEKRVGEQNAVISRMQGEIDQLRRALDQEALKNRWMDRYDQ